MITDPQAVKFVNEYVRPMAELTREFRVRGTDASNKWTEVQALFPNSASEVVDDGRADEGISKLTGQDVNIIVSVINAMNTANTNFATINKACVRPLVVS